MFSFKSSMFVLPFYNKRMYESEEMRVLGHWGVCMMKSRGPRTEP